MNKLIITGILALFFVTGSLFAAEQPEAGPWKVEFSTGFGITQANYSDNWTGGEAGSINWVAFFNGMAKRQLSRSWHWQNDLKLAFGQQHTQNKDTKDWTSPEKSEDKVRYDGILKWTKGWFVDPYAALTVESQFYDGTGMKDRYLNPLVLTETAGIARKLIDVENVRVVTTRLGAGFRQHINTYDAAVYAADSSVSFVEETETITDGGLEWVTDVLLGSAESKYSFNSKLTLFQALMNSKSDELNDDWKEVDINWDNIFRVKVSSIINVGLTWQLLYDKEIDDGGRLKQTLSLGLAYSFANFEKEE
ncbi:DUF3078 domain-containing protein [bacterium]|nr:DUF3078 domain-containing protein [bacterium]MBU1637997.1 DUF3078 domain-containing protein [bacterium]